MVEQFSVVQGLGGRDFFSCSHCGHSLGGTQQVYLLPSSTPRVGFFQDPTWAKRPFQGFATTPPWAGKRQC